MDEPILAYETPLEDAETTEVCVVGAGIAGLSVAYELAVRGVRVVVLEQDAIGSGETGRTTAHLASVQDDRFSWLEKKHGEDRTRLLARAHVEAIDRIEAICRTEHIDCDFARVDGYLFEGLEREAGFLARELEAARRAGLVDAELVAHPPLASIDEGPAIRFPRQARIHPTRYLAGLARAVERRGGRVHTGTRVTGVARADGSDGPLRVDIEDGRFVEAKCVVVATNAPIVSAISIPMKQEAYRSYVVAIEVPRGSIPDALYWDTEDPYHYARLAGSSTGDVDVLVVGGADHKTGQGGDDGVARYEALERWAAGRFVRPGAALSVVARWSGQVLEPADGIALIGRAPGALEGIYLATGDSGQGMTHGAIAGLLLSALIEGRESRYEALFDPRRTPHAMLELLKASIDVGSQYLDWLRPGDVHDESRIPPGSGAVVRHGTKLLAVYRDEAGTCHARSAMCPHLYGVVAWNASEKSWDCPCHGSRFDAYGRVLNGPAASDLQEVSLTQHPSGAAADRIEPPPSSASASRR